MSERTAYLTWLRDHLDGLEIPWEQGTREGETVATLPGERKLRTVVSLLVGERALELRAFVIRNPDENHEEFYRYLLRLGFWTSIRREWAWRVDRGEPTVNLEAFRAELEAEGRTGGTGTGPPARVRP